MEPEPPTDTQKSLPPPHPLPARLLALPPLIYAGTLLWLLATCTLLTLRYLFDIGPPIWLWTALAGTTLGLIGLPIMWWQRTASRRGTRGAQPHL
ncbi:MAG TPA: DUF2530 domain-containing protein [Actinophytocola sp.]|uniref:DUF2530 domain-containing protein n=1 Tax=Actinophytocola sp. TaxID=1872138 RepID=UPI002DDCC816|nr:DUF2530 domain-containing protein [Actinophytocola sp.]HEV2778184.1 DUF2530 domain-containing protein [Actinophytocola sp.]